MKRHADAVQLIGGIFWLASGFHQSTMVRAIAAWFAGALMLYTWALFHAPSKRD